jgi:hypothetical protein
MLSRRKLSGGKIAEKCAYLSRIIRTVENLRARVITWQYEALLSVRVIGVSPRLMAAPRQLP